MGLLISPAIAVLLLVLRSGVIALLAGLVLSGGLLAGALALLTRILLRLATLLATALLAALILLRVLLILILLLVLIGHVKLAFKYDFCVALRWCSFRVENSPRHFFIFRIPR